MVPFTEAAGGTGCSMVRAMKPGLMVLNTSENFLMARKKGVAFMFGATLRNS